MLPLEWLSAWYLKPSLGIWNKLGSLAWKTNTLNAKFCGNWVKHLKRTEVSSEIEQVLTVVNWQVNWALLLSANSFVFYITVYDVSGAASDRNCVVLSDIHIDIMDYIQPASCTDAEFRQMWAEFEWENKVSFIFCMLFGVFVDEV